MKNIKMPSLLFHLDDIIRHLCGIFNIKLATLEPYSISSRVSLVEIHLSARKKHGGGIKPNSADLFINLMNLWVAFTCHRVPFKHCNNCSHCQAEILVQSNFLFQIETTNSFYHSRTKKIFSMGVIIGFLLACSPDSCFLSTEYQ